MDSQDAFHDTFDYSGVSLDVMAANTSNQPIESQLEYGSFWNPELPTSFAPEFMDSNSAMQAVRDSSLAALAEVTFDFSSGSNSSFHNVMAGDVDTSSSDPQHSFYVPSEECSAPKEIPELENTSNALETWTGATTSDPFDFCGTQHNTNVTKRPSSADFEDCPYPKRQMVSHHLRNIYLTPESLTFGSSNTTRIGAEAPTVQKTHHQSSQSELALDEDAADVCSTWLSKRYSVFPSDKDIAALSHLTRMPTSAIRSWFGEFLARGLNPENDSAYMSQSLQGVSTTRSDMQPGEMSNEPHDDSTMDVADPATTDELICTEDIMRKDDRQIGKKSCTPTCSPELLCRDESRIYQCTRKCGKRYVRKCDWKRNEQEGYPSRHWLCSLCQTLGLERAKPCYRRYHFTQHFNNIHPTFSAAEYEADSLVETKTAFPKRCGFCPYNFSSRQERIDHIAEHFKQGKCMLDWDESGQGDGYSPDDDSGDDDAPGDGTAGDSSARNAREGREHHFHEPATDDKGDPDTDGNNPASGNSCTSQSSGAVWENSGPANNNWERLDNRESPSFDSQYVIQQWSAISKDLASEVCADFLTTSPETNEITIRHPLNKDVKVGSITVRRRGSQPDYQCGLKLSHVGLVHFTNKVEEDQEVLSTDICRTYFTQKLDLSYLECNSSELALLESLGIPGLQRFTHITEPVRVDERSNKHALSCCDRGPLLTQLGLRECMKVSDEGGIPSLWSKEAHIQHQLLSSRPQAPPGRDERRERAHLSILQISPTGHSFLLSRETPYLSRQESQVKQQRPSALQLPEILQATLNSIDQSFYTSKSFLSIKFLGLGGFSTVEEVLHRETGLRICRKTVRAQRNLSMNDITQEVEILQQLRHPHIIRLLESYAQGDKLSILLSPVADMTLSVWLEKYAAEAPIGGKDAVLQMFGCLTSSVRYLHEQRPLVAHTDIKPQNILIMQSEHGAPHVILTDFGISRVSNGHLSEDYGPMTPRYCAPEVVNHTSRGPQSDIWSLGCVFLEMALVVLNEYTLRHSFHEEFTGRNYYYKDVPRVHWWLDRLQETDASHKEHLVLETVRAMLSAIPRERPDASLLASVFTPGACCHSWPNRTHRFPSPLEEAKACENLLEGIRASPYRATSWSSWASRGGSIGMNGKSPTITINVAKAFSTTKPEVRFHNALDWLQTCSAHHPSCRPIIHEGQYTRKIPARLLDLRCTDSKDSAGHIVATSALPSTTTYVALSYDWSAADDLLLTVENTEALFRSVPTSALSKPVADAISVTRQLGLRYLWVDALCVIQDSPGDRRDECAKMIDCYRNSTVTITAIPGGKVTENLVEPQSRRTNEATTTDLTPDSSWDTRAWSQQERILSKRTLYLTEQQLYWECSLLKASDTLPRGLPSLLWESVHCHEGFPTVPGLV